MYCECNEGERERLRKKVKKKKNETILKIRKPFHSIHLEEIDEETHTHTDTRKKYSGEVIF